MPTYNTPNPNAQSVTDVLAQAPAMRPELTAKLFHKGSAQHNCLEQFTSDFDPGESVRGQKSVFCRKSDLSLGGAQKVNFTSIGLPGGPGVRGAANTLISRESKPLFKNYSASVDWVRDAFVITKDQIYHLAQGKQLKPTLVKMLMAKMGHLKQNQTFRRMLDFSYDLSTTPANWTNGTHRGNVFRAGNRQSIHQLRGDDVLTLDISNTARAMLSSIGATPLRRDLSKAGCPVNKYLIFGTESAMLNIRNNSLFNTASAADVRGSENASFTGELVDWQGNSFYEMPVVDPAWDDYMGNTLIAKAKVLVEAKPTTGGGPKLVVNAANTLSLYFQWFDGYPFPHSSLETPPDLSSVEYYGAAVNPDRSIVFFAYNGNHNGNQIVITKILSPAQTGTTVDQTTVGQFNIGSTAAFASGTTGVFTPGGSGANLPTGYVYTDTIAPGAMIFQTNSRGSTYTRSFGLGAASAVVVDGAVTLQDGMIEQTFDYGFVKGMGYEMVFGTGIPVDALGRPNGYVLIEHAYKPIGFDIPEVDD